MAYIRWSNAAGGLMRHPAARSPCCYCCCRCPVRRSSVPHIYMLLQKPRLRRGMPGFQDYFRKQHLPVALPCRDAAQDKQRVRQLVAEARAQRVDLLLIGVRPQRSKRSAPSARSIHNAISPDLPVLFMIVLHPQAVGIVSNRLTRAQRHGSLYLLPAETPCARGAFVPWVSNASVLSSIAPRSTRRQPRRAARTGAELRYTLVERELPLDAAGKPDAVALPALIAALAADKVDLLYLPPDSFLNSQRDVLTDTALTLQLPVFAAAEAPVVKSRALFGVVNKYGDVGRFTAYRAAQIPYEGKRAGDLPIELPRRFSF